MSLAQNPSIYETAFAKTDMTDAILVADGKKLHVSKTFLSIHSVYFDKLFNKDFKEKAQIEIKYVIFEDSATLLSLVHPKPIIPSFEDSDPENLLKLADYFSLPAAKNYLDLILANSKMDHFERLMLADKYDLPHLTGVALRDFTTRAQIFGHNLVLKNCSDRTKARIYDRLVELDG